MDSKGQALCDWLDDNNKVLLNDGNPTRTSINNQDNALSITDLTILDPANAEWCTWELVGDLSSSGNNTDNSDDNIDYKHNTNNSDCTDNSDYTNNSDCTDNSDNNTNNSDCTDNSDNNTDNSNCTDN